MRERLLWILVGVALGLLAAHWDIGVVDTVLRLIFFALALGIPASLLMFLWAWLTRR
jgi:hypothetical protein